MIENNQRSGWPSAVLAFVFFGWLCGVPYLLLQALGATPWMGEPISDAEAAAQATFLTEAGWVAILVPLLGLVIALVARRTGLAVLFGVIFGVCLLAVGFFWAMGHRHHSPPPAPEPTHCVERSGGGNECPGD